MRKAVVLVRILYHHRTRGDGAEGVHIREMINAFSALGHEVRCCCPASANRPPGLSLGMTGTKASDQTGWTGRIRLAFRQSIELSYNLVSFVRVMIFIMKFRPELIYERYSCYHAAGVFAAVLCRVPICLEANSTYAGRFPRRVLAFERLALWIENYVLRRSTAVVVVSKPLRQCVLDRVADVDKVFVCPNAINEKMTIDAFESIDSIEVREELGLGDSVVIGFVGSLRRWHGVDMLLRQIPLIIETVPNAKFLIVGSGELADDLEELLHQPELNGRVVATGGVAHAEVSKYLSVFDIGLMPHSNDWGSPMKILEYMAMGKATIAPQLPPIEEIIQDGETGVLFPPRDEKRFREAIVSLCLDPISRRQMGDQSREYVLRERKWTDNARRVLDDLSKRSRPV